MPIRNPFAKRLIDNVDENVRPTSSGAGPGGFEKTHVNGNGAAKPRRIESGDEEPGEYKLSGKFALAERWEGRGEGARKRKRARGDG